MQKLNMVRDRERKKEKMVSIFKTNLHKVAEFVHSSYAVKCLLSDEQDIQKPLNLKGKDGKYL